MKTNSKLGVMIVGVGGAVASTAIAGVELLKKGSIGTEGLPLAAMPEKLVGNLTDYENLVFAGWDMIGDDLAVAATTHNVLTLQHFQAVSEQLGSIKPLAAVCNSAFCHNIEGKNAAAAALLARNPRKPEKTVSILENFIVGDSEKKENFVVRQKEKVS